ncbi:MAG: sulfite exporter TauE/SafE family protein [Planctomycetes bacterium]|nr:sulfite exporter TauE/SafE family protein [Planctomycetota bacterium]
MILLAVFSGAATGLVLGLFGSGGSIIALPALIYLLGVAPKSAIAMSLGVVAVTATLSSIDHWRRGNVDLKVALVFGIFGIIGTFAGARLGVITPVAIQLGLFALVMYAASWRMLRPQAVQESIAIEVSRDWLSRRMFHIALHGIGIGVLTGLVGVGGGFLIVPALVLLSGLPMKLAVGTSLAIVAAKSYAGFAGYWGNVPIDYTVMGWFTLITIVGSFTGTRLAAKISQQALKRGFAWFLIVVASYILIKILLGEH